MVHVLKDRWRIFLTVPGFVRVSRRAGQFGRVGRDRIQPGVLKSYIC